jgi:hypothetical protein
MAEGPGRKEAGTGPAQPPFSRERFEASPEFANFKRGMRRILAVPKSVIDARIIAAKESSPRTGNPKSAGRKPNSGH